MQHEAPAASAFVMSPEYLTPPSAMTGTKLPAIPLTALAMADSCGTPTPETIRVVQIEPGPMPTFMPSTPASTSAFAPSAVATFPAITSIEYFFFNSRSVSITFRLWPWAESTTNTSTSALMSDSARSKS